MEILDAPNHFHFLCMMNFLPISLMMIISP